MSVHMSIWYDIAMRTWPDAIVCGDGMWATVRNCGTTTVELWDTEEEAREAMRSIHKGSTKRCEFRHTLVKLVLL